MCKTSKCDSDQINHGDLEESKYMLFLCLFDQVIDLLLIFNHFHPILSDTVDIKPKNLCLGVDDLLYFM